MLLLLYVVMCGDGCCCDGVGSFSRLQSDAGWRAVSEAPMVVDHTVSLAVVGCNVFGDGIVVSRSL